MYPSLLWSNSLNNFESFILNRKLPIFINFKKKTDKGGKIKPIYLQASEKLS